MKQFLLSGYVLSICLLATCIAFAQNPIEVISGEAALKIVTTKPPAPKQPAPPDRPGPRPQPTSTRFLGSYSGKATGTQTLRPLAKEGPANVSFDFKVTISEMDNRDTLGRYAIVFAPANPSEYSRYFSAVGFSVKEVKQSNTGNISNNQGAVQYKYTLNINPLTGKATGTFYIQSLSAFTGYPGGVLNVKFDLKKD